CRRWRGRAFTMRCQRGCLPRITKSWWRRVLRLWAAVAARRLHSFARWSTRKRCRLPVRPARDELRVLGGAREPGFHRVRIDEARLLKLKIAPREDGKVRNALHVEASSERRVLLRVDLEDDGLTGEIARNLRDMRRGHAAGAAPCGPEVHEDGNFAVADDLIELA